MPLFLHGDHAILMEAFKMEIMIKLFLLIYLLAMVLITILSVIGILTMILSPRWSPENTWLLRHQKK